MTGLLCTFLMLSLGPAPSVESTALPPEIDDAVFRDALRQRGLTGWLEQYLTDNPPADESDRRLRARETLLSEGAGLPPGGERRKKLLDASRLLTQAIAASPEDPRWLRGRLEVTRDLL